MRSIVIIGAGPIGLYIAVRLAKMPLQNTRITVVDKHIDLHTREMIVARNSIPFIERGLEELLDIQKSDDDYQVGMHIKDLEKALHTLAKSHSIEFISSHFSDITKNSVTLTSGRIIQCDLVIDCTGERRAVVSKINQKKSSNPPFKITPIGENPVKDHFLARVTFQNGLPAHLNEKPLDDSVHFALMMEILRNQFGWQEFSLPHFKKFTQWKNKKTVEFYYEMPEKRPDETLTFQKAWLSALLKLYCHVEINDFEITNPAQFRRFRVDPHAVDPAFYCGTDFPIVIPCGDAQLSPDYRQGTGIESGIRRANMLLKACTVAQGHIALNVNYYESLIAEIRARHTNRLITEYRLQTLTMTSEHLKNAEKHYHQSLLKCNEADRTTISAGLDQIQSAKNAMQKYREANEFKKIPFDTNECIFLTTHSDHIAQPEQLAQYHETLCTAYQCSQNAASTLISSIIEKAMLHLATQYRAVASIFFTASDRHKLGLTKTYYEKALEILSMLSSQQAPTVVTLYSNLAITASARQDYQEAFRRAEEARQLLSTNEDALEGTPPKIRAKISFNYWKARLSMPEELDPSLLSSAESEVEELNSSGSLSPSEYMNLNSLIDSRREQLSPDSQLEYNI